MGASDGTSSATPIGNLDNVLFLFCLSPRFGNLEGFLVRNPRENGNLARGRRMDVNARQRTFAMRITSVGSRTPLNTITDHNYIERMIMQSCVVSHNKVTLDRTRECQMSDAQQE